MPDSAREAAKHLQDGYGCSQRRACRVLNVNRTTIRRESLIDKDSILRRRMCELAEKHKRFGSPRLHVLLRDEGLVRNHKRTERIYQEEKLALRRKRPKKQINGARTSFIKPLKENECWAMDFVHDNLADGRPIRILTVVDLYDRICPMISVSFSQTGQSVVQALNMLEARGQLPHRLRTDNGPEFVSNALGKWAQEHGICLDNTRPGKPTDNAHIESFNGKFREECLNQHIFTSLNDAKTKIESWREDYNHVRPHSALGWRTPASFRACNQQTQEMVANL